MALSPVPDRETDLLRAASVAAGLVPVDLPSRWWERTDDHDSPGKAWRVPTGAAALRAWRGRPLALAVAPPSWLVRRSPDVVGERRMAVVTAADVAAGLVPFDVRGLKPASLKMRGLPAQRVAGTAAAQVVVADAAVPATFPLLVADLWLDCESEYRIFCAGRQVLATSPYRIEDEGWSAELVLHRACWHDDAAQFAADVLAALPDDDVPPACVLDVARLRTAASPCWRRTPHGRPACTDATRTGCCSRSSLLNARPTRCGCSIRAIRSSSREELPRHIASGRAQPDDTCADTGHLARLLAAGRVPRWGVG